MRLGSRAHWNGFAFVVALYALLQAYRWKVLGVLPAEVAIKLFTGSLFFFTFVWLASLPWQWDGRPGIRRAGWREAIQAFLWAEALNVAQAGAESFLFQVFLHRSHPLFVYLNQLLLFGPALFLVGMLLAHQDHLTQAWITSRQQADEATGHQLKGQLHPHALFNSLNGLAELIADDPAGAEVFVEAMSGFLRRILDASRCTAWPLEEERRLAEDFLVMEGMRLGSRMEVDWQWDANLDRQLVSPLLVQPLLENAVKHGINGCEAGGRVRLEATREGADLILRVGNTGAPFSPSASGRQGIGLQNLRRRIYLAYGDRAELRLRPDPDGWTWATIRLTLFPTLQ